MNFYSTANEASTSGHNYFTVKSCNIVLDTQYSNHMEEKSKMSVYNRESGILTLSLNDAQNFHRTADHKLGENPPIEFYAEKLRNFGYDVTRVSKDELDVKAPEDEIYEFLSGQLIYL